MIKSMIIAGLGGFVGSALRFLTSKLCQLLWASAFPLSTLIVNTVGSLLIGIFFGWVERGNILSTQMNIFLITGFCGGLTTFSSLSNDIYLLIERREWGEFLLYTSLTFVLGLVAVYLGRYIGKEWAL